MVKKAEDALPGFSLGYPMYHALTGNLPVISKELHRSSRIDDNFGAASPAAASAGGSAASASASQEPLLPGWVELVDPISGVTFWWNTFYRSRRDDRPGPHDDGRRGAGRGDNNPAAKAAARRAKLMARLAGKTWEEKYDFVNSRTYYWNRKANTTQWARPPFFFEDGLSYKPKWQERLEGLSGDVTYVNTRTGETTADLPDDFDGMPSTLTWEKRTDGLWHNWVTGEKQRDKPKELETRLAGLPSDPPPPPPADEFSLEDFVDDDELEAELAQEEAGAHGAHHVTVAEEEEKVYPPMRGWLKKRGGGYGGLFTSIAFKDRYFVSEAGILSYFDNESKVSSKKGPCKGWKINLRYYGVNSMPEDPVRFTLVPTPDAFSAYTHAAGEGMPPPDRVFEFEASNAGVKANWVTALKGKSVDPVMDDDSDEEVGDTTEEQEARRAARKQQAHREAGRGVYRAASHAVIKKGALAEMMKASMFEDAAAAGMGNATPVLGGSGGSSGSLASTGSAGGNGTGGVGLSMRGKKRLVSVEE